MSLKGRYGYITELCPHPKFRMGGRDHTCVFREDQLIMVAPRSLVLKVKAGEPVIGYCSGSGETQYQLRQKWLIVK